MAQVYQPHMGYQRAGKFSERQLILVLTLMLLALLVVLVLRNCQ